MAKKVNKSEKIEFVKLKDGEEITGKYLNFGKSQYGSYIVLHNGKNKVAISLQSTVLRNLIKTNIEKFIDQEGKIEVTISREGKPKDKKYVVYSVFVNEEELKGIQSELSASDMKSILE